MGRPTDDRLNVRSALLNGACTRSAAVGPFAEARCHVAFERGRQAFIEERGDGFTEPRQLRVEAVAERSARSRLALVPGECLLEVRAERGLEPLDSVILNLVKSGEALRGLPSLHAAPLQQQAREERRSP